MNATDESGTCTQADMDAALREVRAILPFLMMTPTGSVYTNGLGKDCDVLVSGTYRDKSALIAAGFKVCAATEYGDESSSAWVALRKGNINVLLCFSYDLYMRWVVAAEVCKWLRVTTKQQRVVIHEIVKNQVSMESACARASSY